MDSACDELEKTALGFALAGIALAAEGRVDEAVAEWARADAIVERGLAQTDFYRWVKGGYGSALYDAGRLRDGLRVASMAVQWELARGRPLSALTIAHSHLELGEVPDAAPFIKAVHRLLGEQIFARFEPHHHATLQAVLGANALA